MLDTLMPQPADALLALIKSHAADPRPGKIDLGVGVYRTDSGATPVFAAVKAAERLLLEQQDSKSYLGPEGDLAFVEALKPHVFGAALGDPARLGGLQTPGGTGGVRLAVALAARAGVKRIHLGLPSWPNHAQIIEDVGIECAGFNHACEDGSADVEAVLSLIEAAGEGEAVLLHGCCHNPTGVDYTAADWDRIAAALADGRVLPIIDIAYQGLGEGMAADVAGARAVLAAVPEALVAYSCDKNFGLYRDRVGAFYVLARAPGQLPAILSNANAFARATWSMPPDHGAAAVRLILSDERLTRQWQEELTGMRTRICEVREQLAAADQRAPGLGLKALTRQHGLFAMLALGKGHIDRLRDEHAIYMAASGRINVAGLHRGNIEAFVAALEAVGQG